MNNKKKIIKLPKKQKKIADKAVQLIVRDYGEVIKKLANT